ncbi:hypothetical protein SK128_013682 [Halocaridina rubra]|uniref:Myb/SANT-like DNA-binding domain-containing protein n=1 Tax=Halocaridina rubra TaxID=373956 RepID=A0AAN8WAP0_HALRR
MSEVDRAKELQDDSPIDLKKPSNKETKSRKTDSMIKDLESESPKSVSSESLSEDSLMKDKEDEKSTKTTKPNFSKGRKRMRKKDETEENGVPDIKSEVMSQTKKKRKKNGVSEEPENGNKKDHIIVSDASEGFNHSATLLFIDCVSKNKNLLKTKQSMEMFSRIRKMMAEEGFTFTEAKLRKKWYNLLVNYRRILERANEIGDLVLSWPYYEPMDNIISDTKALALNNNEEDIDTASNRKSFGKANGMTTRKTSKEVLSLVSSSRTKFDREDNDFQRAFLTEWEEREQRREERDIIKLNLLQKIAKSLETLTRKQDDLIFILKKGK